MFNYEFRAKSADHAELTVWIRAGLIRETSVLISLEKDSFCSFQERYWKTEIYEEGKFGRVFERVVL